MNIRKFKKLYIYIPGLLRMLVKFKILITNYCILSVVFKYFHLDHILQTRNLLNISLPLTFLILVILVNSEVIWFLGVLKFKWCLMPFSPYLNISADIKAQGWKKVWNYLALCCPAIHHKCMGVGIFCIFVQLRNTLC